VQQPVILEKNVSLEKRLAEDLKIVRYNSIRPYKVNYIISPTNK
jgi:hypothetical protein